MNKKEKAQVETAIQKLIANEEDGGSFTEGIDILCRLLGRRYAPRVAMESSIRHISLVDFVRQVRTDAEKSKNQ